jgi:hypothetical protein
MRIADASINQTKVSSSHLLHSIPTLTFKKSNKPHKTPRIPLTSIRNSAKFLSDLIFISIVILILIYQNASNIISHREKICYKNFVYGKSRSSNLYWEFLIFGSFFFVFFVNVLPVTHF